MFPIVKHCYHSREVENINSKIELNLHPFIMALIAFPLLQLKHHFEIAKIIKFLWIGVYGRMYVCMYVCEQYITHFPSYKIKLSLTLFPLSNIHFSI